MNSSLNEMIKYLSWFDPVQLALNTLELLTYSYPLPMGWRGENTREDLSMETKGREDSFTGSDHEQKTDMTQGKKITYNHRIALVGRYL